MVNVGNWLRSPLFLLSLLFFIFYFLFEGDGGLAAHVDETGCVPRPPSTAPTASAAPPASADHPSPMVSVSHE